MTADELYALGYRIEAGVWGVHVFHYDAATDTEICATHHFTYQLNYAAACVKGWELAAADFVRRRLDQPNL